MYSDPLGTERRCYICHLAGLCCIIVVIGCKTLLHDLCGDATCNDNCLITFSASLPDQALQHLRAVGMHHVQWILSLHG